MTRWALISCLDRHRARLCSRTVSQPELFSWMERGTRLESFPRVGAETAVITYSIGECTVHLRLTGALLEEAQRTHKPFDPKKGDPTDDQRLARLK